MNATDFLAIRPAGDFSAKGCNSRGNLRSHAPADQAVFCRRTDATSGRILIDRRRRHCLSMGLVLRHNAALVVGFALVSVAAPRAYAQHCTAPDAEEPLREGVTAALAYETARFDSDGGYGGWGGIVPELRASRGGFMARAWIGGYDIDRPRSHVRGIGDVGTDLAVHIFETPRLQAGPLLAMTWPTGDASAGLGMGHAMVMPAFAAHLTADSLRGLATVGYGFGLFVPDDHVHGSGPIVDPMNRSELQSSVGLATILPTSPGRLAVEGHFAYARPIGINDGHERGIAGVGLYLSIAAIGVRAATEWPLVGNPFRVRLQLAASLAL